MDKKTQTLFGQVSITGLTDAGSQAEIIVYQVPVKKYRVAMQLLDDEMGLLQLCSEVRKLVGEEWKPGVVEELHPSTYEAASRALTSLNKEGFFGFATRQVERAAENMKSIPQEVIEKLISQRLSPVLPPNANSGSTPR